ncbi:NnrU family protein [Yoonia sp. BS5-3]|uniref:NnrU family protein n=1 Tax=Yoonia phaeophyticola TaxID=3137369 RepID=A0ABZ2V397_9RHOB
MIILTFGVALWWAAHLFKRLAPAARGSLGDRGKGLVALLIVISVALMVIGYRAADGTYYWGRDPMKVGINNLLMIFAFYLFAVAGPKGARVWLGTKLRHPQLTAIATWAIAHLIVNGDTPSFVLFGGLLVWAIVEIALINAQDGPWTPPERAPFKKEVIAIVATLVTVFIVMGIHYALGVTPWG